MSETVDKLDPSKADYKELFDDLRSAIGSLSGSVEYDDFLHEFSEDSYNSQAPEDLVFDPHPLTETLEEGDPLLEGTVAVFSGTEMTLLDRRDELTDRIETLNAEKEDIEKELANTKSQMNEPSDSDKVDDDVSRQERAENLRFLEDVFQMQVEIAEIALEIKSDQTKLDQVQEGLDSNNPPSEFHDMIELNDLKGIEDPESRRNRRETGGSDRKAIKAPPRP